MIFRSFIITVFLIIIYSLSLRYVNQSAKGPGQHQWQDNLIKAEKYLLHSDTSKQFVIVGSSLSCRLIMDSLPANFINLSFGGLSLFDGLEIIKTKQRKPAIVFIETNIIKKPSSPEFLKKVKNPFMLAFKKSIPALEEVNQPSTLMGNYCQFKIDTVVTNPFLVWIFNPVVDKLNSTITKTKKSEYNTLVTDFNQKAFNEYNTPVPSELLQKQISQLKLTIKQLEKEGVRFVFFELPMYAKTENSIQMQQIRNGLNQSFPKGTYIYMQQPNYSNYVTSDGMHLDGENAKKFTLFFREQFYKLIK